METYTFTGLDNSHGYALSQSLVISQRERDREGERWREEGRKRDRQTDRGRDRDAIRIDYCLGNSEKSLFCRVVEIIKSVKLNNLPVIAICE